jgi:ATPase components of various ABC-type transport systems, contain duplicated ATPase
MTDAESEPLLTVRDLEKHYPVRSGLLRRVTGHVQAVDGVSFDVREGETVGLVGESGCGKSTTATTLVRLEKPTGGEVRFDGVPVSELDSDTFRRRVQMVFQDPTTAFDPRMTIGASVAEPLRIHGLHDDHARDVAEDTLERVGMAAADADSYPDAFSGGEKQRIALARALTLNPDLLVLDEPVSALDASVQAEILALINELQSAYDLSVLFISHNLSAVRQVCDRVAVMYLGEIVEVAPTEMLFESPQHPYTEALLSSIPRPEPDADLPTGLDGDVPAPEDPPSGCSFHPRCPRVIPPEGEGADLSLKTTRGLVTLRRDLTARAVDGIEPGDVRSAYDLPDELPDENAERTLASAVQAITDDDFETALDRLATVESVCERSDPTVQSVGDSRRTACHHHDSKHGTDWPLN